MSTAKPKILFDNRLDDGTPVASSTAVGYDVLNLRDWAPYTWWKPVSLPATVTVDSGVARAADYALIYGHTLHDAQAAVEVRGSTDNFAASDVLLASSNLLAFPEQFDNAAWAKANATIVPNAVMAPDGTFTMDKLVEDATISQHSISQASGVNGTEYTFSARAKAAERSFIRLANGQGGLSVWFNLANGTIGTNSSPGSVTPAIKNLGDGVYLCSVKNVMDVTQAVYLFTADADASTSFQGDVTKGVFIWGAQHKLGSAGGYYEGIANGPLFLPFAPASYRYWRLRLIQLSGAVMPQIAIAAFGSAMEFPKFLTRGFDPLGRTVHASSDRTEAGHPLGSVIDFEEWTETLQFKNLTQDWLRSTFLPAWKKHLRAKPYGLAWDPGDHADEVYLVSSGRALKAPHQGGPWVDLSLQVSGVVP